MKLFYNNYITQIIFVLIFSLGFSTSRVSFSRSGSMMNIPTGTNYLTTETFIIGASTDIYNFQQFNSSSSIYFSTYLTTNINLGLTIGTIADPSNHIIENSLSAFPVSNYDIPMEFGFHYQHRIYSFKDISISIGIQDLIFNSREGFAADAISAYSVFTTERKFDRYKLNSYVGVGTGKIAADNFLYDGSTILVTGIETDSLSDFYNSPISVLDTVYSNYMTERSANVFLGFALNTPYFSKTGGMDFIAEYDGKGLNIGVKIPLSSRYIITAGIKNLANMGDFGGQTQAPDFPINNLYLSTTSPAIHFGVTLNLPKRGKTVVIPGSLRRVGTSGKEFAERMYKQELDSSLVYFEGAVGELRDSLRLMNYKIQTLENNKYLLEQKLSFLGDSTHALRLQKNISDYNQNLIMKHLARSLKFYYEGDYISALNEAETAIELNPNLAVAYARRGSIYFQLGDIKRAGINWNMALKLDPDYDEVREILKSVNESQAAGRL